MFWVLDRPLPASSDTVYGAISPCDTRIVWKTELCKTCGRIKSLIQVGDLCVELFGKQVTDFVWVDDPSIIIGRRLYDLLKQSDLTGFDFRKVDIISWHNENAIDSNILDTQSLPNLFQLVVTGKGGSIFPLNKTHQILTCKDCQITTWEPLDQIIVDDSQWDKSDIFNLSEFPGYTLVSEKFGDFLSSNGIEGCSLTPSVKYSMRARR
jgi:hypothetical protein